MHVSLGPMMQDDTNKDVAAEMLKKLCEDTHALAYCFISEAWCSKIGVEDAKANGMTRPSELPDHLRTEIVMSIFETKDWNEMVSWEVVREDKEPWLYEIKKQNFDSRKVKDSSKKHSAEGRFSGFVHKRDTIYTKEDIKDAALRNFNENGPKDHEEMIAMLIEDPAILDRYVDNNMDKLPSNNPKLIKEAMREVLADLYKKIKK